ncbi:hypothetical protein BE221DRAFT_194817 [Ostreococcus tauri]|uniref:Uncharacterized protein n=1 Tax=Ostreococcus tauri TaxID=70448 RepID=A0A1Y5I3W5_OSTTA|nr:hypothetical protein BE221DRAFT_194817 [Ostreococcus tauri]
MPRDATDANSEVSCALRVVARSADGRKHVVSERMGFTFRWRATTHSSVTVALVPVDGRATHWRYERVITREVFDGIKAEQTLTLRDAVGLAETCARALSEDGDGRLCVLSCESDGRARLEIVEDGGHRLVSVLELPFVAMGEEAVRREVSEEYASMQRELGAYRRKFGSL